MRRLGIRAPPRSNITLNTMFKSSEQSQHYKESREYLKTKTKSLQCPKCGKIFVGSIFRPNLVLCDSCKEEEKTSLKGGKVCQVCGTLFYKDWRSWKSSNLKDPPRFCSQRCSSIFSSHASPKDAKKIIFCKGCNTLKEVSLHASSNCLCKDCQEKRRVNKRRTYLYPENTPLGKFERSQIYKQKSINLKRLGFNFNAPLDQEYSKLKDLLNTLYIKEGLSTLNIDKRYNIPAHNTIPQLLRLCDIPVRTLKQASAMAIQKGRLKPIKSLNRVTPYYKQGYYRDKFGRDHYLRSSLEFSLAEKLDSLDLEFDTEVEIDYISSLDSLFHKGYPDFYIPDYDLFIELKGKPFYDEQNLKDRSKSINDMGKKFLVLTYSFKGDKPKIEKIDNFNNIPLDLIQMFVV